MDFSEHPPPEVIIMEAQVALRIIKHVEGVPPSQYAQGQLLGLDVAEKLHVTTCFGYRKQDDNQNEISEEVQEEMKIYRSEMISALNQVNQDANSVGWYTSTAQSTNFVPDNFLEMQFHTQRAVGNQAVAIICDPNLAGTGQSSLKAYRLDLPSYMLGRNSDVSADGFILTSDHLIEIPIDIRCSPLVEVFLNRWIAPKVSHSSDALNCDLGGSTENGIKHIIEGLQRLQSEQSQIYQYERQQKQMQRGGKGQNQPLRQGPVPNDTLLTTRQIGNHCDKIGLIGTESFSKLYLARHTP